MADLPEYPGTFRPSLEESLAHYQVPFLMPNSAGWQAATRRFNQRLRPVMPRVIVQATTVEQVQQAVVIAREYHLNVSAKSGGHSYGNFGFGEDMGMVIQLDQMHGVKLWENNTATIKAGSRLGHVATELYQQGHRAVPHGTCPSVGFAGHALHGGYGFSSNKYGLTLDWVIGMDVVLANGTIVYATRETLPDLFWAMCGAGSSFGIVVSLDVKTFEAPDELTWIKIKMGIGRNRDVALRGLKSWQAYVECGVPEDMLVRLFISNSDAGSYLEAMFYGGAEAACSLLDPLTEPLELDWAAASSSVKMGDWPEHLRAFNDRGDGVVDIRGPDDRADHHYASSLVTKHIPDKALKAFVNYWFTVGKADARREWWIQMDMHGGPSSAISRVACDGTAYPHRDKTWLFQFFDGTWTQPDLQVTYDLINGFMDAIKDNMLRRDWGRYANYADSELDRTEALEQYYAGNLPRLRRIKELYDPYDMFRSPQSIEWSDC